MNKKILIVQLGSYGDCLMATALARQLKKDHPDCVLTWAISYKYKSIIENNQYIDSIWEIRHAANENIFGKTWLDTKREAEAKKQRGEFDEIFYSQIVPDNLSRFDGTTRSSLLRVYPSKITVPVTPVLKLYDHEIKNVAAFIAKNNIHQYRHVILCECLPSSKQSFLNPELMLNIAKNILRDRDDTVFIISSHKSISGDDKAIIDASALSFRENAELSKYCTLLVGCSSGLTWLLTSEWAKKIPTVQFLNKKSNPFTFASVKYDFNYYGLPADHILECTVNDPQKSAEIIKSALENFSQAKEKNDEILQPSVYTLYLHLIDTFRLFSPVKSFLTIIGICKNFAHRNSVAFKVFSLLPFMLIAVPFSRVYIEFKNRGMSK